MSHCSKGCYRTFPFPFPSPSLGQELLQLLLRLHESRIPISAFLYQLHQEQVGAGARANHLGCTDSPREACRVAPDRSGVRCDPSPMVSAVQSSQAFAAPCQPSLPLNPFVTLIWHPRIGGWVSNCLLGDPRLETCRDWPEPVPFVC